jgi:hypothetical protein
MIKLTNEQRRYASNKPFIVGDYVKTPVIMDAIVDLEPKRIKCHGRYLKVTGYRVGRVELDLGMSDQTFALVPRHQLNKRSQWQRKLLTAIFKAYNYVDYQIERLSN